MPPLHQDTIPVTEFMSVADSFPATADTLPAARLPLWDTAAVYGENSEKIVQGVSDTISTTTLAANAWLQILPLIVLVLYCWMVYYFRDQSRACLKALVNFKTEEISSSGEGNLYGIFVNYATAVTIAALGIMTVKGISATTAPAFLSTLPDWFISLAPVIASGILSAVILLQFAILKAAGKLTFSTGLADALIQTKKLHLSAVAILVVPFILLYTGLKPSWDTVLTYITVTQLVVISILFVARTFILFMGQKVSLLVWILYLCAVEIMPLSLAVLLVTKNV